MLIEHGSVGELSGAILKLREDRALADDMGRKGRERALKEYSADSYYGKLIAIYQEAIEERSEH